jgi:hypothetical protein
MAGNNFDPEEKRPKLSVLAVDFYYSGHFGPSETR